MVFQRTCAIVGIPIGSVTNIGKCGDKTPLWGYKSIIMGLCARISAIHASHWSYQIYADKITSRLSFSHRL